MDSAGITRKDWDSEFFGREIWSADPTIALDAKTLARILEEMDEREVWGIECHVPSSLFRVIPQLENAGFRLVDTRAVFRTEMDLSSSKNKQDDGNGSVRFATKQDYEAILEITDQTFVSGEKPFPSRFNNRGLFSENEAKRYYRAWITNNFDENERLCSVFEVEGEVVGYFLYGIDDSTNPVTLKGLMAGVRPEQRGSGAHLRMQHLILNELPYHTVLLDNTTQVTNIPVIRNHIRSSRWLKDTLFTFYRLRTSLAGTPM